MLLVIKHKLLARINKFFAKYQYSVEI